MTLTAYRFLCTLPALLLFAAPPTSAETAEEKGLMIAREVDRRNTGFGDSEAQMTMTLKSRSGATSVRRMRMLSLEIDGDGDKSMSVFDEPADIKGTAFLTYSHSTRPDEQWLYLPASKKVKKISTKNKSGPFMGSEFAYEDISSQELEKYTYRFLREDTLNGKPVLVNEQYPAYKNSGYQRQIVWIDKSEYIPLKIEFYDRKNTLRKTLTFSAYQQYQGRYWRAHKMLMVNSQNGKSTLLVWDDYRIGVGLEAKDFSKNALKRTR